QQAHQEEERRPQVGAPDPPAPDLLADDHLGDEQDAQDQETGGEPPVNELSSRQHPPPLRDRRSTLARRRARTRVRPGRRIAAVPRTATKSPARADAEA